MVKFNFEIPPPLFYVLFEVFSPQGSFFCQFIIFSRLFKIIEAFCFIRSDGPKLGLNGYLCCCFFPSTPSCISAAFFFFGGGGG